MLNINKWYSLLAASLLYFIYTCRTVLFEGVRFLDYVNLIVNFGLILLLSIWLISKSTVTNRIEQFISFFLVLYLYVLHSLVTSVYIPYYFTQKYLGNHFVHVDQINLIPFKTIFSDLFVIAVPVTILQTLGNLLLLSPLAFALLSLGVIGKKYKVILVTFLTSLFIEIFQFFVNYSVSGYEYGYEGPHAVDIDDLILNTTGGVIGVLFFMIYKKMFMKKFKTFTRQKINYFS
ncbi:VanZ family protein [Paenibacillus dakarensis]|uniref:VanZ family protein n=1 Tax=Paenibacillus dakarensis TaxID=1527293 RepID=UPI0006D546C2|nr:VanZ family protein [Paenibacillus dakarensis]